MADPAGISGIRATGLRPVAILKKYNYRSWAVKLKVQLKFMDNWLLVTGVELQPPATAPAGADATAVTGAWLALSSRAAWEVLHIFWVFWTFSHATPGCLRSKKNLTQLQKSWSGRRAVKNEASYAPFRQWRGVYLGCVHVLDGAARGAAPDYASLLSRKQWPRRTVQQDPAGQDEDHHGSCVTARLPLG